MKTAEEARDERLSAALAVCFDTRMGTLWRVREDLWAEQMAGIAQYTAKRQWHPGVSLRQKPVRSVYEYIPMLHGTSGDQGPIVVRGITKREGPDYPTSFGRIVSPALVSAREIVDDLGEPPAGIPDYDPLMDRRVVSNHDKPRLNPSEMKALTDWAEKKGLM
jgi:Ni,Fe-hydrogenase III component G